MDELDTNARAPLAKLQEEDSPTRADADRIKARVLVQIVAGATALGTTAAASSAGAALSVGSIVKATVAATVLLGAGAIALTHEGGSPNRAPRDAGDRGVATAAALVEDETRPSFTADAASEESERSAPAPEPSAANAPAAPANTATSASSTSASSTNASSTAPAPAPRSTRTDTARAPNDLGEEARLLSAAHAALRGGKITTALALLQEHRARFPRGVMRLEREAATALAHCQGGDRSVGRASALAFRNAHPGSPMIGRLEVACQLEP